MRIRTIPLLSCLLAVLATASLTGGPAVSGASARFGPTRDVRAGILDAALVVIVKQQKPDLFKIERLFLGKPPAGGTISLPGFKLFEYGDEGPDKVEAITPSTRILLLLKHPEKNPHEWEITQEGNCFFWVNDARRAAGLDKIATTAIRLRTAWETARATANPEARVNALWPYLWDEDRYFFKATLAELIKLGSVSGDYTAARFESLTPLQRKMLLGYLGAFGGSRLHQAVVAYVKKAEAPGGSVDYISKSPGRQTARIGARSPGVTGIDSPNIDADTSVSDGLEGLISFKDHADLQYIRDLALSAAARGYRQTCYSALSAFAQMPEKENLPVIDEIRRASANQVPMVVPIAVVRTLAAHKYPETVPQLASYLDDRNLAPEAERYLSEIIGKDLGKNKQAWLEWYAAQPKSNQAPRVGAPPRVLAPSAYSP